MIKWLQAEYESIFKDGSGALKVHRGKVHKYLEMSLDFSHKGQYCVTMFDHLDGILLAFDAAVKKHSDGFTPVTRQGFKTPAPNNLFVVNEDCEKFLEAVSADFHTISKDPVCDQKSKTRHMSSNCIPDHEG
jgi:hypothetical protein